jgi:hypothetical protein
MEDVSKSGQPSAAQGQNPMQPPRAGPQGGAVPQPQRPQIEREEEEEEEEEESGGRQEDDEEGTPIRPDPDHPAIGEPPADEP